MTRTHQSVHLCGHPPRFAGVGLLWHLRNVLREAVGGAVQLRGSSAAELDGSGAVFAETFFWACWCIFGSHATVLPPLR